MVFTVYAATWPKVVETGIGTALMHHLGLKEIYFLPTAPTIGLHVYCLYMCASESLLFQSNTFSVGNYFNNKAFALDVVTRSLKWRPVYCYKLPSVE